MHDDGFSCQGSSSGYRAWDGGENLVGRAIGADRNSAVNVGTPHPHFLSPKRFQHTRMRVAVGIARTERDDGVPRPHVAHEIRRCRCFAS